MSVRVYAYDETSRTDFRRLPLSLLAFEITTACFHLIQGVTVLGLLRGFDKKKDFLSPVYAPYLVWPNMTLPAAERSFSYEKEYVGQFSVGGAVFAFFLLSFSFQFFPIVIPQINKIFANLLYEYYVQPFRWCEYSVSASLMAMIFAVLNGTQDIFLVVSMFFLFFATMFFGLIQELFISAKIKYIPDMPVYVAFLPFVCGCVTFSITAAVFLRQFQLAINHSPQSPPQWVFGIYSSQFILLMSFAIVQFVEHVYMFMNYKKPKKCETYAVRAEFAYTTLSLLAKSILCWVLYANAMAENSLSD